MMPVLRPRPFLSALVLLLLACRDSSASEGAIGDTGIQQVQSGNFEFGSTALDASKGRTFTATSRVNQNFLRRGTRADLERIHIERLLGRRGKDDWLLAGSDSWLERRKKLDREAMELRERIAIAEACLRDYNIEECEYSALLPRQSQYVPCAGSHVPALVPRLALAGRLALCCAGTEDLGCNIYCGRRFPCAGCNDGLYNGDEGGVDCGGSCVPCATCHDMIQNGAETGIDCGGEVCDECEVFAPEPEPGEVCDPNFDDNCSEGPDVSDVDAEYRPPGCTAVDARDCIQTNQWTAQSGAHLENMPWYQPTAEFYPWLPGTKIYNSSHWEDYTDGTTAIPGGDFNNPGADFFPADAGYTSGAHTFYGR